MAKSQANLTPQEQAALFELMRKSGTQPTSGEMPQSTPDMAAQQGIGETGAAGLEALFGQQEPQTPEMPAPGSFKDDPQGAIKAIEKILLSKTTGPQLTRGDVGLEARLPHSNPLLKMFGMKQTVPVEGTNFFDSLANTIGQEQAAKLIPEGVARTPEGKPFIGEKTADQILQMTKTEHGNRILSPETSALTVEYWRKAAPSLVPLAERVIAKEGGLPEWLGKAGPSYRLSRSEFGTPQGFTEDGEAVEYDMTKKQWYVGGKETPADQIGRLMSKTRPQMSGEQINEVTNLLNAQNQLQEVKSLFDPSVTGPIQNKLLNFQELTGIQIPDLQGLSVLTDNKVKLRTVLGSAINDYIKAITGAQMSEPEARRIMKALPKAGSADEAFLPALEEIMKITEQKLNTRLDVLETQDTVGIKKLRELAGRAAKGQSLDTDVPVQEPPKPKLKVGTIKNGYMFNGGNPGDKANWTKVGK